MKSNTLIIAGRETEPTFSVQASRPVLCFSDRIKSAFSQVDYSLVRLLQYVLYGNAGAHYIVVEGRLAVFGHEDRFNKKTNLVNIAPQAL